ncbi:MAG: substrate-binding domain-containing protein, partial [Rhizobiaceae bacterium]
MTATLKTTLSLALALAGAVSVTTLVQARDQIRIVGSSTVFPFSTAVAEQFGQNTSFKTPVVESTGSGGGMKLFCAGTGEQTPDITNASRRIKEREFNACIENGVTPVEVKVGFDGIVMGSAKGGISLDLTPEQIFLALAREIPVDGKLVANPNKTWKDVDASLPDVKIEVLGPPPTSGTRDAFAELALEGGARKIEILAAMRKDAPLAFGPLSPSFRSSFASVSSFYPSPLLFPPLASP